MSSLPHTCFFHTLVSEKYELPGIRLVWFNFHVPTYSDHEGFKAGHACCNRTPIHAPEALRSLEADFWAWRMEDAPEFATAAGETCHNDLLESFDISVYQTRKVLLLFISAFKNRDYFSFSYPPPFCFCHSIRSQQERTPKKILVK